MKTDYKYRPKRYVCVCVCGYVRLLLFHDFLIIYRRRKK